ncbi:hypothetical protein Mal4_29430 [Maioricimonas rarisocia]|uniref:Leucine Rich repeats (2 copies) n=2 Tax=Maioricimonas rarisocia TaxID=2528026 RepID=A0A517Z813_9PLAN|nr:hypothetical protein Mal4_29430 [Maioricimonas rarisocia]
MVALDLGDAAVTDSQLESIVRAPKLQQLTLNGSELTEEGLSALAAASAMSRLTITDLDVDQANFRFSNASGVDLLLTGGRIGSLELGADDAVTTLSLQGIDIGELTVRDCNVLSSISLLEMTADTLMVESCPQLESFFCGYESKISTLQLRNLPRLYLMTIQERANPGELDWSKLPAVRRVSYWAADIDERHMRALTQLPGLVSVDVSGTDLGEEAAAILAQIPTLQQISASGSFQLAALEWLASLPELRSLKLYHHDGVDWTPEQARQLFDHMRELTIF